MAKPISKVSPYRILLLENIHPVARDLFIQRGFEVVTQKSALSPEALLAELENYDAIGVRSKTAVPSLIFEKAHRVKAFGCFCVGTNHVELTQAQLRGVPVFNAPFSNTRSVAEMVISHIISLARQVGSRNIEMHQGTWNKRSEGCYEVRGKTLGVIGYGNIGSQAASLAEALGMRVVYYDVLSKLPRGNAKPYAELGELLANSDFVTCHVPSTMLTKDMLGAEELKLMKKGAYLINASRGDVVDISALAENIRSGHLGGAAIDVFPVEPESNSKTFQSPLMGLHNVILTPHIGGATEEAQNNIGREVAATLIRYLESGCTEGAVNFPVVSPPDGERGHRLLNVHANVPGVLKDINQIVASTGANIQSQHLATDAEIGYLVIDFDKELPENAIREIERLPASIRTRVVV